MMVHGYVGLYVYIYIYIHTDMLVHTDIHTLQWLLCLLLSLIPRLQLLADETLLDIKGHVSQAPLLGPADFNGPKSMTLYGC